MEFVGRAISAASDESGCFRLPAELEPPFELSVFNTNGGWLGRVIVDRLNPDGSPKRLTLSPEPYEHEQVTVRARLPVTTEASPAAASAAISREQNLQNRPLRLSEAVAELPGAGHSDEGHTSVPFLRGLGRGRTLLLLDGARVSAERRAGPSGGYLDPLSLETIEVVRGPGSLAYGADALGGVIHASTPRPRPEVFHGRLALAAGSADQSASGLLETNVPLGKGALLAQAHQSSYDDYEAPGGRVKNSGARARGLLLRALTPLGGARLLFGAQWDEGRDTGKPSSESETVPTSYPREDSYRATLAVELPPFAGLSEANLEAFLGSYRLVTERDRLATGSRTRQISQSDVDAQDAALRLTAARISQRGLLRFGFDAHGRFDLEARGLTVNFDDSGKELSRLQEVSIADARRGDFGLFTELERALLPDRLRLAAGLRADTVLSENSGGFFGDRSSRRGALSGYGAATLMLSQGKSLTVQYARGFREPNLSDRYFRGTSGRGFLLGNPDLRPERSDQYDAALRAQLGPSARLALYGYLYRIRNLIERYSAGPDFRFRNRGEEELTGVELESEWDITSALAARVTFNWARGRIRDDGSFAADVPATSAALSARHSIGERFWWRGRLLLAAADEEPGPTEKETPGYGVLDFSAGFRLTKRLEATLAVKNAADKSYPASSDENAAPAPGRSLSLILTQLF